MDRRYQGKCQPFIVKEMKQGDFKDFKKASDETIKAAWKSDTGQPVKYYEVMWFSYGQSEETDFITDETKRIGHKDQVWCRYTCSPFENESWTKVSIFKRNKSTGVTVPNEYIQALGIKAAKLKDLQGLGMKKVLPDYAVKFYNSLTVMGEGQDNENDEDFM